MKCIYCLKDKPKEEFSSTEHVISQFLGKFRLAFVKELVCRQCNNADLSKLEKTFAEDSKEGIQLAMMGVRAKRHVRIKGKRIKMTLSSDGELGSFQEIFPFVGTSANLIFRPHVIFREPDGEVNVLFVDELERLTAGSIEHSEIRDWIKKLTKEKMSIFGDNEYTLERIVSDLKGLGVTYTEKSRESFESVNRGKKVQVEIVGEIDDVIRRLPCKIALNYFAYCAKEDGLAEILFNTGFNSIRDFILKGVRPTTGLPIRLTDEPTLFSERGRESRLRCHQISFLEKNRRIIAKVTLLGEFNYEIDLGPYTLSSDPRLFGCGHIFNPFLGKFEALSPTPLPLIGKGRRFGLFQGFLNSSLVLLK